MARSLSKLEPNVTKQRHVGLDDRTYRKLRSAANIVSTEVGTKLHLNQVISILIHNYIYQYGKGTNVHPNTKQHCDNTTENINQ